MENASKFLVIAGAILMAILVITLGVFIFNTVTKHNGTEITDEIREDFNNQFLYYESDKVYGKEVKSLIQKVVGNNKAQEEKQVAILYEGTTYTTPDTSATGLLKLSSNIVDNAIYKVSTRIGTKGLIDLIIIE